MTETKASPKLAQTVGFAVGVSVSMLFFDRLESWRDSAFPRWMSIAVLATVFLLIIVPALLRRDFADAAIGGAMVPNIVGTGIQRFLDPDPPWTDVLRAASVMLVLVVVLVVVLMSARRVRELDRLLFTEATSIAFFVTVVGATAYAGVQALLDTPQLSFAWISLFGFAVWGITALLLRRRYT